MTRRFVSGNAAFTSFLKLPSDNLISHEMAIDEMAIECGIAERLFGLH